MKEEDPMPQTQKKPPVRRKSIFATRWPLLILIVAGFLLVYFLSK